MVHRGCGAGLAGEPGTCPLNRRRDSPPPESDPHQEAVLHRPSPGGREAMDVVFLDQEGTVIVADDLAGVTLLTDAAFLDPDRPRAEAPDLGHRMRHEKQRAGL